jgi:4-hydroxy-tetrahydrodipicolinate reductase
VSRVASPPSYDGRRQKRVLQGKCRRRRSASGLGSDAPIRSVRTGGVVGVHEVVCVTYGHPITLVHESCGREVFAAGVRRAALWLVNRPFGFHDVEEVCA